MIFDIRFSSDDTETGPEELPEELLAAADTGMLQLLPGVHESDGFFFARLRKE